MFILSNINSGIVSSLKKLDKPLVKINKIISGTTFAQNSVSKSAQIKHSLEVSSSPAKLSVIPSFISSIFSGSSKNTKLNQNLDIHAYSNSYNSFSSTQDEKSLKPLLSLQNGGFSHASVLSKNFKLIHAQTANKVDYRYNSQDNLSKSQLHKSYYFTSQAQNENKQTNFNLDSLLANFTGKAFDSNFYKNINRNIAFTAKDSAGRPLNHHEFLQYLNPNVINIKDVELLDNYLAVELAKDRQNLLVSNGSNFYVFTPRLEFSSSTKNHEVFWHYVDENSKIVSNYEHLNSAQQKNYLNKNITNLAYKRLKSSHNNLKDIYAEIGFLHKQSEQFKTDILNIKQEYKANNNKANIGFSRKIIDLEQSITNNNKRSLLLNQKYDKLKDIYNNNLVNHKEFENNIIKIIDELFKQDVNIIHHINNKGDLANILPNVKEHNALSFVEDFILTLNQQIKQGNADKFSLNELLTLVKNPNKDINLIASERKSRGIFHELTSINSLITKTNRNLLSLQSKLQQTKANFSKSDKDIFYAIAKLYGKTSEQFIKDNPNVASKLLAKQINLTDLLNQAGQSAGRNGEVYDLNTVFRYKNVIDHSAQKNGKSIIDNVISKSIQDKKPLFINLEPKHNYLGIKNSNNPNKSTQLLLEYDNQENKWQVYDVNAKQLILSLDNKNEVSSVIGYLEYLTNRYQTNLYLQVNHEKTRAEYRFKGYTPLGSTTHKLFNKLLKHHHTWNDDIIVDRTSTKFQFKDKYALAPSNLAGSSADFADKNIGQYTRAEQALIYKWNAHEIRGDVINYKQTDKALLNPVSRFVSAYLNPLSYENRQGWKSGRQERLAKMNREDRAKRIVGNAVENGWQSIDNWWAFIINSIARGADSQAFKDGTVNWSTHMATCTQSQLMGDALGVTSKHSKSKTNALSSGLRNTTNDLTRQINNATKKNEADLALFENIYEQTVNDKNNNNIHNRTFSIDGKNYPAEEAQKLMQARLFENMTVFQDLLWQHKAQNKSVVGIAFFKQLFQNIVRMGFIVANGFLPGVSIPLSKLTRLFRMIFQFVGAGADGLLGDEYLLRTNVNMPGHQMTKEAINYNLDHIIDNLSTEDFEKHVIRIMTRYGHTTYTEEQINALPTIQKKLLLAKFVFSPDAIHDDVSYNVDGRVGQAKTYLQETFADYDARFKKYNADLVIHKQRNDIKNEQITQHKLDVLAVKQKDKIEQATLFYRGLAYADAKNASPQKYVDENWKYAWETLAKKYPKSKIVNLLRTDNPFPVIGYAFKNLMKNPMEVLHHTLFRSAFVFWGIDEVGFGLSSATEQNGGDETAQKIAVATWYSYVFVSATIGGVASYLEHIGTNGRPANHKSNISAFIVELQQVLSKFNQQVNSLKFQLEQNNLNDAQKKKITQELNKLEGSIQPINKVIELLNNDINPQASIKNISDADSLSLVDLSNSGLIENSNQNIIHKEITKSTLEQYTSELLATSVASILPNKPQHDKKQTDKNWVENIQKNVDFWVKGESIFSYPLNQAKKLFTSKDKQEQELANSITKAKQELANYTQNIFAKHQGNYINALNDLFSQTGHEVNKSLFIQQISDIQTQTSTEIGVLTDLYASLAKQITQNKQNLQINNTNLDIKINQELEQQLSIIKLKLDNFKHLQADLTTFLHDKQNQVLSRKKYIDISNGSTKELFEEHNSNSNNADNPNHLISFKLDDTLNFNNRRLDKDFEIADTKTQKFKLGAKRTGNFLYERVLNPFGRKSFSKYLINPSYRHWLPYMLLRQAAILPVKLVEFSVLSAKSGHLSHSLQKTSNNSAFKNITKTNIVKLDKQIVAKDAEIKQEYTRLHSLTAKKLADNQVSQSREHYYALHNEKDKLTQEREKLLTYGYQVWRTNDKLFSKPLQVLSSVFNPNNKNSISKKPQNSSFKQSVQNSIQERRALIS